MAPNLHAFSAFDAQPQSDPEGAVLHTASPDAHCNAAVGLTAIRHAGHRHFLHAACMHQWCACGADAAPELPAHAAHKQIA